MSAQSINGTTAERDARSLHDGHHKVAPGEIAVGVVIGRTSEFFDFFVYAIASVLVFPSLVFPYVDALTGTLYSFGIFALAFAARPVGTLIFTNVDRLYGRGAKLTIALFLLGGSTAAIAFLPGYETIGHGSALLLALFRMGQGVALGGSWDGLASLLAINAPEKKRGWYAMIPQLGAPLGLLVAASLFGYFLSILTPADFLGWGWRYPFFVAFAINVVALFARLRIVDTPEFKELFETNELTPTGLRATMSQDGRTVLLGVFVPLASFAMFHMVTVFPLSWIFLYTDEAPGTFLLIEAAGAGLGVLAMLFSGWLSDKIGREKILIWGAWAIGVFALTAPLLLNGDLPGVTIYMMVGFLVLGFNFAQSSGAVASLFDRRNRYTASAVVSALAWMFGAGFAPLSALLLSTWFGLFAAGLYLLSGAVCSLISLALVRQISLRPKAQEQDV